jgi:uncharacterized protein (TIGR00251 family)
VTSPLTISPHPDGALIDVWVVPRARRNEIVGVHDGALRVRVSASPEGGKANKAVARLLEDATGAAGVYLQSGARSRRKRFMLVGVDSVDLAGRLG